jgi:hypothetical protein
VVYKKPAAVVLGSAAGLDMSINFDLTKVTLDAWNEAGVGQSSRLQFSARDKRPLELFLQAAGLVRDFLTLATNQPVTIRSLSGSRVTGYTTWPSVSIRFALSNNPTTRRSFHPNEGLFNLSDVEDKITLLIAAWFEKFQVGGVLRPVYELYFSTLYRDDMYIENRFLNTVSALEVYHRKTIVEFIEPVDQFASKLSEILGSVPARHKKWMKGRLKGANDPYLELRLRGLFREFRPYFEGLRDEGAEFTREDNVRTLCERAARSRNYYTHRSEKLEEEALKGIDLVPITMKFQFLLKLCFLKELNLSPAEVSEIRRRKWRQWL